MSQKLSRRRDPVHALLLGNLLWGIGLGLAFVAGVYALDLGHIRTLVASSPDGLLAMALLTGGSVITFASVVMGGAIMMIPREEDEGPKGGRRLLRALVPLRVRVPVEAQTAARRERF